jgi:ABC-type phosphate/phosphonate transport system substrate-binding protein
MLALTGRSLDVPRRAALAVFAFAALLCANFGCQAAGQRLLSLIGIQQEPLSIALVIDRPTDAAQAFNPFPAYGPLQRALSEHLGRPVAIDACFPFQVESGLASGWHDLAVLTPVQYAGLRSPDTARVLAVSVDKEGRIATAALLVVPVGSEVAAVGDLRAKVVAFGPAGDLRAHHAALKLLADAGLQPTDLSLEVLPVPSSLKHMPDGRAVAQSVLNASSAAGFVDQTTWDAFPERAGGDEPTRDKFRVLARTVAVPDRLLLASPRLDDATAERVLAFGLRVGTTHPQVMEPLTSSGYAAPTAELLADCRGLAPPTAATTTQP